MNITLISLSLDNSDKFSTVRPRLRVLPRVTMTGSHTSSALKCETTLKSAMNHLNL